MFCSREEAQAIHDARHRLRTCKAGQGWVFCPYVPGATYCKGHYVHESRGWEFCTGEGQCSHHHLRLISKLHVPALVAAAVIPASTAEKYDCDDVVFRADKWQAKIVELTAGCIETFNQDSKPDQLAVTWRAAGRNNNPLHMRWLRGCLKGVPKQLRELSIEDTLPAIIHGKVAVGRTVELDNSLPGPIKHNSNLKSDCNDYAEGRGT